MLPKDEESPQVMARLEAALANSRRLGEIHDFVDKCNSDLQLNDAALTQNLKLLHRALGRGAFQEAEECARSVQGQLEAGLRKQWQLGEDDDLWGRAAHWASVRGLPDFSLEILQRSPHHQELHKAMVTAGELVKLADRYFHLSTQRLREAIYIRDLEALNAAIEAANDWFVDESDQDGSPGSAVPRRPRPPISVADRH